MGSGSSNQMTSLHQVLTHSPWLAVQVPLHKRTVNGFHKGGVSAVHGQSCVANGHVQCGHSLFDGTFTHSTDACLDYAQAPADGRFNSGLTR